MNISQLTIDKVKLVLKDATARSALNDKANIDSPTFTGTPTAPTATVGTNTDQIATTAFVMNSVGAISDVMIFKGTIGASGATVTSLPANHKVGETYKVASAGTYAGQACEIGDLIICVTAGTSANNAHWTIVQNNLDGAVTGPTSSTANHVATFVGTSGKVIQDSGYTINKSVPSDALFTDTNTTYTFQNGTNSFKVTPSGGSAQTVTVTPSIADATTSKAGLMSVTDKAKLDAIADNATANTGTVTGVKVNGTTKTPTSGVVDIGTVVTDISGKADKSATVSNVAYDSTNKKLTKTINGTTSDIVTASTLKTAMSLNNVENKSSATIRSELTKDNVITALGYTPPTTNTTYTFDGTYNATSNKAATVSTVTNAINALDGGIIGTPGAGKTVTALSQENGNISATFEDISITKSQVSDFPTLGAAASKGVTDNSSAKAVTSSDTNLITARTLYNAGYTKNTGTVTGVKVNGTTVNPTSGIVDIGTVLTSHQSLTDYAPKASPALTGTPTAPTAAAGTNTTQIATTAFVKAAVDASFQANDAMLFKGTIGSSGATVTALPATHYQGWTYKVITAGSYAGVNCEIGDMIICITDGTSANNAHWTVVQSNIDGAVTGPASSVANRIATFDGTSGKVIKDSGYTIATSVPSGAKFTDTTYTFQNGTNSFTVTSAGGTAQTVTVTPSVSNATTSAAGLMSKDDKSKLDGIAKNATANTGTVTSVRVQATSPVTSSTSTAQTGTLNTTIALADAYGDTKNPYGTKTANTVLAGPASGSAAAPTFRALTADDIPSIPKSKISDFPTVSDSNVKQTATTTNATYEVLFSGSANNTTDTTGARKTSTLTYNPSTKLLTNTGSIKSNGKDVLYGEYSASAPSSPVSGQIWLKPSAMSVEEAKVLILQTGMIDTLPVTISDSAVTADMVLMNPRDAVAAPSAQSGPLTVDIAAGEVTISGTLIDTTNIILYLLRSR